LNRYFEEGQACARRDIPGLACQVVDQAKRVFDIASRKIGLILDDFTAVLYQPPLRVGNVANRHFQDWAQSQSRLDEQVDVFTVEADHLRVVVGNFESEMLNVKKRSFFGIWRLNQNVCAKAVCHVVLARSLT
jgi:hypothetical protein